MRLSAASTMDTERMGSEDWAELQRNLEATIPVYDRINRFALLGKTTLAKNGSQSPSH
ncbi:MAG: hypothetical protein Ct9H90mP16_01040 [Candidatus Poseidoniales archaeon]|nr:MAG: hypothetical protein Ct9H90mP16_01040 [Candidatus Poseidoniales archaeon]